MRRFNSRRAIGLKLLPGLEIAFALRVTAVAVYLRHVARAFAVGAAISGIILNHAIAGGILARSSFFIVCHLSGSPGLEFVIKGIECFYT
jgi:hypothetical protein